MNDVDDTVMRLIADVDPLPNPKDPEAVSGAWAMVEAELSDDPVVVPLRRSNRWRRVAVVGAIAAVALAGSAGAVYVATQTGIQNPPEWVPAGGPGELYRLDGTDFPAQLTKLAADVPYPSDTARQASLAAIVAEYADSSEPEEASTGALRAEIARGAICYWTMSWKEAGSDAGRASATTALRGALTWPAVTAVDPKPAIDGEVTDFGHGPTVFGYLPGIIDAAARGDAARLTSVVDESAYCATATREPRNPATEQPDADAPGRSSETPRPSATPVPTTRP